MSDRPPEEEPVPKLPRGRGMRLSRAQIIRIVCTLGLLVVLIATQRPCANAVSKFVTSFDGSGSSGSAMPKPGAVDLPSDRGSAGDYERLRPGMTDDEVKAAIARAREKAEARDGSGSAGSAGSGR